MKSGTIDSMKFKRLQRNLGESIRGTAGLLTVLWQRAYRDCPRGDIGRFSNEEIAIMADYGGDPDELLKALVTTGWIDRSAEHRLVIHDWHDHVPNWVRGVVAKKGGFASQSPTIVVDHVSPTAVDDHVSPTAVDDHAIPRVGKDREGKARKGNPPPPPSQTKLPTEIDSPAMQTAIADWLAYKGNGYKPRGFKALLSRLTIRVGTHGEAAVIAAMERAMSQGYKGWDFDEWFESKRASGYNVTAEDDANWSPV